VNLGVSHSTSFQCLEKQRSEVLVIERGNSPRKNPAGRVHRGTLAKLATRRGSIRRMWRRSNMGDREAAFSREGMSSKRLSRR
jgi:hypothetical protein